jgi:hypothetical protein
LLAEDQPNHFAARGPESHTDSDFTRPASDGVGQDAIEADAGEQQRQRSEGRGQRHHEPLVAQRLLDLSRNRGNIVDREGGADSLKFPLYGRCKRSGVAGAADVQRQAPDRSTDCGIGR